jgi:hypothetical protein
MGNGRSGLRLFTHSRFPILYSQFQTTPLVAGEFLNRREANQH